MKTNIPRLLAPLLLLAAACDDAGDYAYRAPKDNIYFNFADTAASRVTYSFAYPPEVDAYTVNLPVIISGQRVRRDRTFHLEIIPSLTTAAPTTHHAPLAAAYTIPADSGTFNLPVTLYRDDPMLLDSTFVIALRLVESPDFATNLPLTTAIISFSNRLEKPWWWDRWAGDMGAYSRNKHFLFLCSSGTVDLNDPSTDGEKTIQSLNYIKNFKAFLFDPVAWVAKHPDYAFVETVPATMFEFYDKTKPDKRVTAVLVNMGPSGNRYIFFDDDNAATIIYM
ncbi:MAG: DUF4843 domain-containing protein [Odoribacteraceae bacterium]|jgi:hypothetical protein|nr:DUF4843 domain-containing protein [Odoribacteraceae bacterium]